MIEAYLRQSALDHLGISGGLAGQTNEDTAGAEVRLAEKLLPAAVNLRGDLSDPAFAEAVTSVLGVAPPAEPNTAAGSNSLALLWLGPDEWIAIQHDAPPEAEQRLAAKLREALGDLHAAVTEIGEQYACIHIAGAKAREVIVKGSPLDLHPRVFGRPSHETGGRCAQTHLAKTAVILHQVDEEPAFDLYTRRSFSDYLWRWLADAGREYGLVVTTA